MKQLDYYLRVTLKYESSIDRGLAGQICHTDVSAGENMPLIPKFLSTTILYTSRLVFPCLAANSCNQEKKKILVHKTFTGFTKTLIV
jgi:hypothetical protein